MSFESSRKEGEIAEQMFIDYMNYHNKTFLDERDDEKCREYGFDFITLKGDYKKEDILKHIKCGNYNERKKRQKVIGCAIEVKMDKVIHNRTMKNGKLSNGTNNFVYEEISHNMPGWAARSYADNILYVCVDTFDEFMTLSKVYLVDLYKLRENYTNLINEKKAYHKQVKYVEENGILVEENIHNLLININAMLEKDICKDITDIFKDFFPMNIHIKK